MDLVSSCLAGFRCRYDGTCRPSAAMIEKVKNGEAIPFCPEQAGGAETPRIPCEISGGTGMDVLAGTARVLRKDGADCTDVLIAGAKEAMRLIKLYDVKRAFLKAKSPSCGCGTIYDGTFSSALIQGDGVLTAQLKQAGVEVVSVD